MGKLSNNHIVQKMMDNRVSDKYTNTIIDASVTDKNSDGLLRIKLRPFPKSFKTKTTIVRYTQNDKTPVVDMDTIVNATLYKPNAVFGFSICYNTKNVSGGLKAIINDLNRNDRHELSVVGKSLLYPSIVNYVLDFYGGFVKSNGVTFYPQDMFVSDYSVCEIKQQ